MSFTVVEIVILNFGDFGRAKGIKMGHFFVVVVVRALVFAAAWVCFQYVRVCVYRCAD